MKKIGFTVPLWLKNYERVGYEVLCLNVEDKTQENVFPKCYDTGD